MAYSGRQKRDRIVRKGFFIFIFVVLITLPLISPRHISTYHIHILTESFILGLFALGLNFLMGYAGIISFGHAMFFALGGYTTSIVMVKLGWPLTLGILIAVIFSALFGFVLGFFARQLKGVYVAMLTFAAAQMIYEILISWDSFLGGTDGLLGIPKAKLVIAPHIAIDMTTPQRYYYFCLFVLIASIYVKHRLLESSFGRVLVAIKENELRVRFIGYPVNRYKMIAFLVSGLFSGLAGALFASLDLFVSPQIGHWMLSGEVILMMLIGGMGTLLGPVIGAGFFVYLREFLTDYTDHWHLVLGVIFVLIVIFLPKGLYHPISRLFGKRDVTYLYQRRAKNGKGI